MKKMISIVIPAYNEEEVLDELKKRLQSVMASINNYDFEVIIAENGSHDSSYAKLTEIYNDDPRFKIVRLSRNFGSTGGILAGLSYAKGDAAVVMCADLQDPPEMIVDFVKKWEEGYDVIYAYIMKREGVPLTRRLFSSAFYKIISAMTNKAIPENASEFRLMDRKVYTIINNMHEDNKFIRGLVAWTGFKQIGIPFERPPRFAGESKADFITVVKLALDGIFSFSNFPLQIAMIIGVIISVISFIAILLELALFFIYGREVPGFTTLIIVMLFLFGMLFLILGIIGEYLARIYDEVKHRPSFIVDNTIGLNK